MEVASLKKSYNKIELYHAENLESCPWPDTEEGQYAKKFIAPLIKAGVSSYIDNIQTELKVILLDDLIIPITVNDAQYDNSYICSPYSYFISYAKESLSLLTQSWAAHFIKALLWSASKVLHQCHFNKVIIVNNWLLSTNLFPPIQPEQIGKIGAFLQKTFPHHAIIFRSVDPHTNSTCYDVLQKLGFDYVASRQIFFIEPHHSTLFESRLFKSDLKLLKGSGYEVIDSDQLEESDVPRMLSLYNELYIDKYSQLNPKYNVNFLSLLLKQKLMYFKALRKEKKIDGVVGYVVRNGMMFCPFFGYDHALPKEPSLYRLLSTVLMQDANEKRLLFHQCSGASMFKKIRKADSCIEYTAVYQRHLGLKRQIPWFVLKNMCNSLGVFYMKRY